MKLFQKSMELYGKWQADGLIESYETVLLSAHGGDLNGFVLIRGDAQKLGKLRRDDSFQNMVVEANYCLEGYGLVLGFVGDGLTDILTRWSKIIGE
jgi:hypothetical protein